MPIFYFCPHSPQSFMFLYSSASFFLCISSFFWCFNLSSFSFFCLHSSSSLLNLNSFSSSSPSHFFFLHSSPSNFSYFSLLAVHCETITETYESWNKAIALYIYSCIFPRCDCIVYKVVSFPGAIVICTIYKVISSPGVAADRGQGERVRVREPRMQEVGHVRARGRAARCGRATHRHARHALRVRPERAAT